MWDMSNYDLNILAESLELGIAAEIVDSNYGEHLLISIYSTINARRTPDLVDSDEIEFGDEIQFISDAY